MDDASRKKGRMVEEEISSWPIVSFGSIFFSFFFFFLLKGGNNNNTAAAFPEKIPLLFFSFFLSSHCGFSFWNGGWVEGKRE